MRFTGTEKARYPDADIIGRFVKRIGIGPKELGKMLAEFAGHDVFFQFLGKNCIRLFANLDNTTNDSVDIVPEHVPDNHRHKIFPTK